MGRLTTYCLETHFASIEHIENFDKYCTAFLLTLGGEQLISVYSVNADNNVTRFDEFCHFGKILSLWTFFKKASFSIWQKLNSLLQTLCY